MRAFFEGCRKRYETGNHVTQFKVNGIIKKIREMRAFFKACRKRYETGNHVTRFKVNGIIENLDK